MYFNLFPNACHKFVDFKFKGLLHLEILTQFLEGRVQGGILGAISV